MIDVSKNGSDTFPEEIREIERNADVIATPRVLSRFIIRAAPRIRAA